MEETTARTEPIRFRVEQKHLQEFLKAAVGHFRIGEDNAGLNSFLSAMEELEHAVETDQNLQQPHIDLNRLLPALRGLYFYMRNQDLTGVTDLLEDTIYPMTEEWLKGRDEP